MTRARTLIATMLLAACVAFGAWLALRATNANPNPNSSTSTSTSTSGSSSGASRHSAAADVRVPSDPVSDTAANAESRHAVIPSAAASADGAAARELGASWRGRILDARGNPIADADVYLASAERTRGIPLENLTAELAWAGRTAVRSDRDGRFSIATSTPGPLRLGVRARGFAPLDRTLGTRDARGELGDLVLEDTVLVSGRVVDSTGHPISGAAIRRLAIDASPQLILGDASGDVVAVSDADGAFRIEQLARGSWWLLVRAQGHPDTRQRLDVGELASAVSDLELVLEDGADVRGRVVGAPPGVELAALSVVATPIGSGEIHAFGSAERVDERRLLVAPRRARCASDGAFVLLGLAPNTRYRVVARDDASAEPRTQALDVDAGARDVVLAFRAATAIVFDVVDATTSEPITELELRVGTHKLALVTARDGTPRRDFPRGRVRIDEGLPTAPDEAVSLVVAARGYAALRIADLRPRDGAELDLGALRLARVPTLDVRVVDAATRAPVRGARVALALAPVLDAQVADGAASHACDAAARAAEAWLSQATTDADGLARVNDRGDARARLRVEHADYARFESELAALARSGDAARTIELSAGARVRVDVVDVLGEPQARVLVFHASSSELGGDAARADTARAPRDDARGAARAANGSTGEPADWPGTSSPAWSAAQSRSIETDAHASALFTHLEPGVHEFWIAVASSTDDAPRAEPATAPALAAALDPRVVLRARVELTDTADRTLVLVLPARCRAVGRVTDAGEPVSGATLFLRRVAHDSATATITTARTNGNGDYTSDKLEPGAYEIEIVHPTRAMPLRVRAELTAADERHDFALPSNALRGRVLDADGAAVAGARVSAVLVASNQTSDPSDEAPRARATFTTTDADGRYELRGLEPDVDVVIEARGAHHPSARSEPLRVAVGETRAQVDLRLERGAALELRVLDAGGAPLVGCEVSARLDDARFAEPPATARTDAAGVARLRELRRGVWRVRVAAPVAHGEKLSVERPIELEDGATRSVAFELR